MQKQKEEYKFTIDDIMPIAITFVVVTIVLAYGAVVVQNVQTSQLPATATAACNVSSGTYSGCSLPYNISGQGLTSLNTFATNLPLLATIVVAAIIITILIVYLGGRMMAK